MSIYDFTFYDLINRNAISFNEKQAWFDIEDSRSLTFAQYKQKVDFLAAGIQRLGVMKGDRIAVLGKNSIEYFLIYGAAAALGAVVLPINWRLSIEEIEYNLNDCEPKLLFVDQEFQKVVDRLRRKLSFVEKLFNLNLRSGKYSDFRSLMQYKGDFQQEEVTANDEFIIIHTAAVAGKPRGALLSHGNVICANLNFAYVLNLGPHDVNLSIPPLFHIGGLIMTTASFHAGSLTVNMKEFDPSKALELIHEKGVTVMLEFPPILSSILEQYEKEGININSLRGVGGLDIKETIEKYQRITGGSFYSMYGQTETSSLATCACYSEKPGSAGRMLPLADVRILDDYDSPVASGAVGEITVRGPMVFKGYWALPEDNEYTFREGRHHTGDLGRFDEDGFLWYVGRKPEKELIKTGGENVYPIEVEKVILQHPAVERVVVFGVPDPKWQEAIKAVCQLKEGQVIEPQELIDFVGEGIARYKKPQYVEFVTDFPLLENRSPDRAKMKKVYGGG